MISSKSVNHPKQKDLGIFYTPPEVVDFIYDILNLIKTKEDKETHRWESHKPRSHYPSVMDPACGEGVFLKKATESGFTKSQFIFGLDLDNSVVEIWPKINLLEAFDGQVATLRAHFFCQNGLDKIHWEQHKGYYKHHLKLNDVERQQFDAIVGNPPYGGTGLEHQQLTNSLIENIRSFQLIPKEIKESLNFVIQQGSIFEQESDEKKDRLEAKARLRLKTFPIEVLFLERFIQLAKPGGIIAIVIPDGILANSTYHYVRKFVTEKTKVLGIVSLPRETFKDVGTNAKTSILFLKKKSRENNHNISYPVFMASTKKISHERFAIITEQYKYFYMNKLINTKQFVDENLGLMIRSDKTLKELMVEKPSSRWDSKYWHPKYDYLSKYINISLPLKNILEQNRVISADTIRASRGESYAKQSDKNHLYLYLSVEGILPTGYDYTRAEYGSKNAYNRLIRSELKIFDIAISRSGTGSLGKCFIYLVNKNNIVSDLYIIRCDRDKINPFYVLILLKSKFGKDQIDRNEKGVSGQTKLTVEMIENFLIPNIDEKFQKEIETSFLNIHKLHEQAILNKIKSEKVKYEELMNKADENLLKLIRDIDRIILEKLNN